MRFSANLGFLWADRPLPDAIRAAHAAGFDAVECHWPYDTPAADVARALRETGLPMLGLNTRRGDVAVGENGLAALPGREKQARAAIDEAVAYAAAIGAGHVHVMGGAARGPDALATFRDNLAYACARAAANRYPVTSTTTTAATAAVQRRSGRVRVDTSVPAVARVRLLSRRRSARRERPRAPTARGRPVRAGGWPGR